MATAAVIAAVSIGASVAGGVVQARGQRAATKASKRAEDARQQASRLETQRVKRRAIRDTQIAQADTESNAVTGGVDIGSSAIQGGVQSATSQQNRQILAANQGQELGDQVFQANRDLASARRISSIGQGIASIGQQIFAQRAPAGRLANLGFG